MNEQEMEKYFSQWFDIIPFNDLKEFYEEEFRGVLLLSPDGTDRYIEGYTLEELKREHENGALFGLERD